MNEIEMVGDRYVCPECRTAGEENTFATPGGLAGHRSKKHDVKSRLRPDQVDGVYVCEECAAEGRETSYKNIRSFRMHLAKVHNIRLRRNMAVSLTPGDDELIDWLAEFFATTRGEAIKTCIRGYVPIIQKVADRGN